LIAKCSFQSLCLLSTWYSQICYTLLQPRYSYTLSLSLRIIRNTSRLANNIVINGASVRILKGRRVDYRSRLSTTTTDRELRGYVSSTYYFATGRKGILLLVLSILLVNVDRLLGLLTPSTLLISLSLLSLKGASLGTSLILLSRSGYYYLAITTTLA
jgi:hypothetical protein